MPQDHKRLHVVDALRGFAILAIMLLHNIEHFDFYFKPEGLPAWMQTLDQGIWDSLFFLFGGKAYAIFALLFGLTFSIQLENQARKGADFRGRFAWRLILLFGFGLFNSAFYEGDVLMVYALLGFVLIPVCQLGTRTVLALAVVLLLQPFEWYHLWQGLQNPALKLSDPASWAYFGQAGAYLSKDSLLNTWVGNLTNGRTAVLLWTWEMGRVGQTCALFLLGMLAGRHTLFTPDPAKLRFWRHTLVAAALSFGLLYGLGLGLPHWIASEAIRRPLAHFQGMVGNLAFMLVLVSGFTLLHHRPLGGRVLNLLAPIGRMSLSNYLLQSFVGTVIYYGFGLGLYRYTGATYCLLIGLLLAAAQCLFSHWWLKRHRQGPLETLWHQATWVGYQAPAAQPQPASGAQV